MASGSVFEEIDLGLELLYKGKVRNIYGVDDDRLVLIATDRLSAFDCILPTPIPAKGVILTQLSKFWFHLLEDVVPNHVISTDTDEMPILDKAKEALRGRATIVRKTEVLPVECVVRGYLEGSGWKEYQQTGMVCGIELPAGLRQCDNLPEPIFTPATKASSGHDENIDYAKFEEIVGKETAEFLRLTTLAIYRKASEYAAERGIIIADTKFEFGRLPNGEIILIDEALTPDSSRFWPADKYEPGKPQPSFDKQFVREYLETLDWDKTPPAPPLPREIVNATAMRYLDAYRLLTGRDLRF
ncbi:MAG: phosphoribosylaminoimidazolesuccinocarboxamide synthase [Acidobacteriota bacterium]|nr:MAG: phosphoribosylaminoimidazolesuccinocarboxamide synthase [Acidobacteriota bacterium]